MVFRRRSGCMAVQHQQQPAVQQAPEGAILTTTTSKALADSGLGTYTERVAQAKIDLDIAQRLKPESLFDIFDREVPFGDCVRIVSALQGASSPWGRWSPPTHEDVVPLKQGWWTMPSMMIAAGEADGSLADRVSAWSEIGVVVATLFLAIELDSSQAPSQVSHCQGFWTESTCHHVVVTQNLLRAICIFFTMTGTIYFWGCVAALQVVDAQQLDYSLRKHWSFWSSSATGTSFFGIMAFAASFSLKETVVSRNWFEVIIAQACIMGYLWASFTFLRLTSVSLMGAIWRAFRFSLAAFQLSVLSGIANLLELPSLCMGLIESSNRSP